MCLESHKAKLMAELDRLEALDQCLQVLRTRYCMRLLAPRLAHVALVMRRHGMELPDFFRVYDSWEEGVQGLYDREDARYMIQGSRIPHGDDILACLDHLPFRVYSGDPRDKVVKTSELPMSDFLHASGIRRPEAWRL